MLLWLVGMCILTFWQSLRGYYFCSTTMQLCYNWSGLLEGFLQTLHNTRMQILPLSSVERNTLLLNLTPYLPYLNWMKNIVNLIKETFIDKFRLQNSIFFKKLLNLKVSRISVFFLLSINLLFIRFTFLQRGWKWKHFDNSIDASMVFHSPKVRCDMVIVFQQHVQLKIAVFTKMHTKMTVIKSSLHF